ncbi:MAG: DinB family protein [Planctomycetaceae bacterium]|nr:DinB family protein [Planctomycetaceae bacterium]
MIAQLIKNYETGTSLLSHCIANMTDEQLDAQPIANRWSTREVVCHIADFEPINADRMKRVIAEDVPTFLGSDPDQFAAKLCYNTRDIANELRLIETVRIQMATIFKTLDESDFQRTGIHSRDGELTLKTLLERITGHIPHHVELIEEKKRAIGL